MTGHVDEDVVCKHCESRSRPGYLAADGMSCSGQTDDYGKFGFHDWVPVDEAHQYDIEVSEA